MGDRQPWQRQLNVTTQPHDENQSDDHQRRNYFTPNRFYYVETLCSPCGVVLAWTKFAKAESPTNILTWLENIYPVQESRPSYIAINKACQVVRTAVQSGLWEEWRHTTRFIVDSYHYINHKATDNLCRTYCNPAPSDGSAPNLVGKQIDQNGNVQYYREFNTEACEQLNAWLGGFESILKRMTIQNFNWFLHVMLFYHSKHVLFRIAKKKAKENNDSDDSDGDKRDNTILDNN